MGSFDERSCGRRSSPQGIQTSFLRLMSSKVNCGPLPSGSEITLPWNWINQPRPARLKTLLSPKASGAFRLLDSGSLVSSSAPSALLNSTGALLFPFTSMTRSLLISISAPVSLAQSTKVRRLNSSVLTARPPWRAVSMAGRVSSPRRRGTHQGPCG